MLNGKEMTSNKSLHVLFVFQMVEEHSQGNLTYFKYAFIVMVSAGTSLPRAKSTGDGAAIGSAHHRSGEGDGGGDGGY